MASFLPSASQISCIFMLWKPFLLTNEASSSCGAWMRTCVPSTVPITLGKSPTLKKSALILFLWASDWPIDETNPFWAQYFNSRLNNPWNCPFVQTFKLKKNHLQYSNLKKKVPASYKHSKTGKMYVFFSFYTQYNNNITYICYSETFFIDLIWNMLLY